MTFHDSKRLTRQISRLLQRVNYERQTDVGPRNFKLQTMLDLMHLLEHPHLAAPVIHIAGTKGKGSVSKMVGEILSHAGYRTGIYSSPHLERINQRISVDGRLIEDGQFSMVLDRIEPAIERLDAEFSERNEKGLTFFEIITAAGFQFFADQQCDAVVLEVGLGGRLDSTNVCQPTVCVITNISLDHTRLLGDSIDKIAFEKAGIIKPGVPVVSAALHPDAIEVISRVAKERGSRLYQLDRDFFVADGDTAGEFKCHGLSKSEFVFDNLTTAMPGAHQQINAAIASTVSQILLEQGWKTGVDSVRSGLKQARLPGRTEIVSRQPFVVLDIAHNGASMSALVKTFQGELSGQKNLRKRFLIATTRDKQTEEIIAPIIPVADELILTRYQDNPRGKPVSELSGTVNQLIASHVEQGGTAPQVQTFDEPVAAWDHLCQTGSKQDAICVAGSAFLIAELRPRILEWASADGVLMETQS